MSGRFVPSTVGNGKDIGKARGSWGFVGIYRNDCFLAVCWKKCRMDVTMGAA